MCLDYFFKKKYGISKPNNTKDIGWKMLHDILIKEFNCDNIVITDKKYKTAPFVEYERFLRYDKTDKLVYVSEWFDCDDFAVRLYGNFTVPYWSRLAFGEIFVKTETINHALNFFIDNDHDIWLVEPQNDEIFKIPDNWEVYRIDI